MEALSKTKDRIMMAAADIFAEYGYRHGTVRQIADKAGVNVAAVNYHFGSKDNLYKEVLQKWTEKIFQKYPNAMDSSQLISPEDKLYFQIRQTLGKLFDEEQTPWFGKLFVRMVTQDSTEQLGELADLFFKPSVDLFVEVIKELCGDEIDVGFLYFTALNIIGQCVFYYSNRKMIQLVLPNNADKDSLFDIDSLGRQITEFSLAGIKNHIC